MFGLIYLSFEFICSGLKSLREHFYNGVQRHSSVQNSFNYPMYIDYKGQWRDAATNKILIQKAISVGNGVHDCLCEADSYRVVKDFTAEQNLAAYKKAKQDGATVIPLTSGSVINHKVHGKRFVDIQTGQVYVSRLLPKLSKVYMDINTYKFIRPMDEVNEEQRPQVIEMIDRYNQYQEHLIAQGFHADPYNNKVYIH